MQGSYQYRSKTHSWLGCAVAYCLTEGVYDRVIALFKFTRGGNCRRRLIGIVTRPMRRNRLVGGIMCGRGVGGMGGGGRGLGKGWSSVSCFFHIVSGSSSPDCGCYYYHCYQHHSSNSLSWTHLPPLYVSADCSTAPTHSPPPMTSYRAYWTQSCLHPASYNSQHYCPTSSIAWSSPRLYGFYVTGGTSGILVGVGDLVDWEGWVVARWRWAGLGVNGWGWLIRGYCSVEAVVVGSTFWVCQLVVLTSLPYPHRLHQHPTSPPASAPPPSSYLHQSSSPSPLLNQSFSPPLSPSAPPPPTSPSPLAT